MIYKKFLLVSSVMFSASSDSDISYKNIASNQVEKILNSEEMHKALEIFDVIHKYDNQCSFSNIGYTPLYFQYTDDGKFCPRSFFDDNCLPKNCHKKSDRTIKSTYAAMYGIAYKIVIKTSISSLNKSIKIFIN